LEIGFVLHNLIFLVERFLATEYSVRPLAATKSETQISKSETNPNLSNLNPPAADKCPKQNSLQTERGQKNSVSIKGRTCAFGLKIVVFEHAAFQLTPYQTWNKKNLKISIFVFWIPARLADLP